MIDAPCHICGCRDWELCPAWHCCKCGEPLVTDETHRYRHKLVAGWHVIPDRPGGYTYSRQLPTPTDNEIVELFSRYMDRDFVEKLVYGDKVTQ